MSLCLIDVHGDIEGDFEWVEDLPKNRKEFLIAIKELEKIKEEIKQMPNESWCDCDTVDREKLLNKIDKHISELKGEYKMGELTTKEIIEELRKGMPTFDSTDEECERYTEAYKMAIKALEQEPCNVNNMVHISERIKIANNASIYTLEKIKDKMMDDGAYFQEVEGHTDFVKGISHCIDIVEKELLRRSQNGQN